MQAALYILYDYIPYNYVESLTDACIHTPGGMVHAKVDIPVTGAIPLKNLISLLGTPICFAQLY
ncbi:MAG: hypothetical protein AAFY72_08295 [Cyanobacteria bacterium J06649_4]